MPATKTLNKRRQFFASMPRHLVFTKDARLSARRFAVADGKEQRVTLAGTPILYAPVVSGDRGGYFVRLLPGSAVPDATVTATINHDFGRVIGSTKNGTLRTTETPSGVQCEIDLPDTSDGNDAAELVGGGYCTGMSFSMVSAPQGEWIDAVPPDANGKGGSPEIFEVSRFVYDEITITPIPSYEGANIEVAGADDADDADDVDGEDDLEETPGAIAASKPSLGLRIDQERNRLMGLFAWHMTSDGEISVNNSGMTEAIGLIHGGHVDSDSPWTWDADDENALLGKPPNWDNYAKWFLAVDKNAKENTKEQWKYPFGKNGKVYRRAVAAIRSRASQQGESAVFAAAGKLMGEMDTADKAKK